MDEGQASFFLNDLTVEAFIGLPPDLTQITKITCEIRKSPIEGLRRAKGAICLLASTRSGPAESSHWFNSLIELMPFHFHNFVLQKGDFCTLESITWRKCKNMLLNQGNVANMLAVKVRERLLFDARSRQPTCFLRIYSGKFTMTSRP